MFEFIQKFFEKGENISHNKEDEHQELLIATCSLLIEMATVDGEFSEVEKRKIIEILQEEFKISQKHAREISNLAQNELDGSIDLWNFTNLINKKYDQVKKLQIIEYIWEIIYSDKILNSHEDYLVHKLSNLLNLPHSQLIEAKLRAKNKKNGIK